MEAIDGVFRAEERMVYRLRRLYEGLGYQKYRMRKFEEYGLYADNKAFLKDERIITFSDLDGKLLALKPDVTLSIVKNMRASRAPEQKLYYTESVYRCGADSGEYREIGQVGLEYFGQIDRYAACEVVYLALETLRETGGEYILDISHMGFVAQLLKRASGEATAREEMLSLLRQKNAHGLRALLTQKQAPEDIADRLCALCSLGGDFAATMQKARALCVCDEMTSALDELSLVYASLSALGQADHVRLDFSIINDLDYYNGIVFQGYIRDVPRVALSGGRYDPLLRKFSVTGQAIGFALYPDELSRFFRHARPYDVDTLCLYTDGDRECDVLRAVLSLCQSGVSARACRAIPQGLRYRRILRYENGAWKEQGA